MGKDEKIHQRATNSIVVTTTRSNVLPKDTHKQIIQREKPRNLTNNPFRSIQINEVILDSWKR
jgi:hypothetical protein